MSEYNRIQNELVSLKDELLFELNNDVVHSKASQQSKELATKFIDHLPKMFDQIETLTSHIFDILLMK